MIFQKAGKSRKAQTVNTIVMLVVGLVVVGMLLYLGYKYILGTGESVGKLGGCEGQGGTCKATCNANTEKSMFGLGCPKTEGGPDKYCCIPNQRVS